MLTTSNILNTVTNADSLCRAVRASPHATSDRTVRGDSGTGHVAPSRLGLI
jgi:hypothetical protein